jgi:HprK-related kinase A
MEVHFKILDFPFCIKSNSKRFLQDFGDILHYFKAARPDSDQDNGTSFQVSIDHLSTITDGNRIIYQSPNYRYILEYLEYEIYNLLIDKLTNYYLIHAGVVSYHNKAILFPAQSGSGKTTLIAGLLKNGFRYLTDEIAVIEPQTLLVYPFLKPLNIKMGSLPLFANFEPEMELINKRDIGVKDKIHHVLVRNGSIHPADKPIPAGDIIFVQYDPRAKCRLTPISRVNTIFDMAKCSFNQYRFKEKGIDILHSLVRRCRCYQLKFSQVGKAVDLIETVIRDL